MGAELEFSWSITEEDIRRVKRFVRQHETRRFVVERRKRNLALSKPEITKDRFWKAMVGSRLTSVQRAGPLSPVSCFLNRQPFPLPYDEIRRSDDPENVVRGALTRAGGIRFTSRIPEDLITNLKHLEAGGWKETIALCDALRSATSPDEERRAAEYIRNAFKGFGPKQSRNLLQSLGLTRYEIPIDSRITSWLKDFDFPVPLSVQALSDSCYYDFISDGIQALCKECAIEPCILDAAVFSAKDGDGWETANILY